MQLGGLNNIKTVPSVVLLSLSSQILRVRNFRIIKEPKTLSLVWTLFELIRINCAISFLLCNNDAYIRTMVARRVKFGKNLTLIRLHGGAVG